MKNKLLVFMQKNKIGILITTIILVVSLLVVGLKPSYALDSKIYTRKQMQEMVVSTALSLFYNNYFSDYGQKTIDSLGVDDNYYNYGTVYWRDLTISPEEVGYSKYFHIDCSAYNFLIYKNTLGYDMSEFSDINRHTTFYQNNVNKMVRVKNYTDTLKYHRAANDRFGHGWNNGFLGAVARKISNTCSNSDCTKTSKTGILYNNLNNKKDNELVYFYEANGKESLGTLKSAYGKVKSSLQPGDVIIYSRMKSDGDTSGHVVFYAGDDNDGGYSDYLLHSTGADYNTNADSKNNRLRKGSSIRASAASTYVEEAFTTTYNNGGYITRFAVFRPLNTVCTDDNTCKINNNSFNVKLSDVQLKNNEARVALKKNQVHQYMISEKSYNSSLIPTSTTKDGYTRNIMGEMNSVNEGDVVTYKLRVRNKLNKTSTKGLTIEAVLPSNASYVNSSCSENCTLSSDGKKIVWSNVSIEGSNVKKDFIFKVKTTKEGTLTFDGFKIITSNSKELQLNNMKLTVGATQNGINKEMLYSEIKKFKSLVDSGQIKYVSSGSHSSNIKDLDDLIKNGDTVEVSGLGFIKMMYYNAFGFDLDQIDGTEAIMNSTNIRDAIFTKVDYPDSSKDKSVKVYGRKLSADREVLTGVKANISEMLVPGLYGGKHMKGNDTGTRVKFLRSFVNNSAYQSDLEIGDIIIAFTNDSTSMNSWLYLGDNEYGPVLHRFTIATDTKNPLFLVHTDKNLETYYNDASLRTKTINKPSNQILNELFSKDLFVVLRPSRLGTTVKYNYNGGIAGTDSYVAYNTYNNLVKPKKDNSTLTLKYNKTINGKNSDVKTINYTFDGWYSDSALTKKVTNSSKLSSDSTHTLYAKYKNNSVVLPGADFNVTGYNISGWYSDSALTKKVGDVSDNYIVDKNVTLYAKWDANKYSVKYDANGGSGTMSNSSHTYGVSKKLSTNQFIKNGYVFDGWSITKNGEVDYLDESSVKNLTTGTDTVTLYAVWREVVDTDASVSVNVEHGVASPAKKVVSKGENTSFVVNPNVGYGSASVSCTNNQVGVIDGNILSVNNVSDDTVCNVVYSANKYTIKYNSNGGSGTMNDTSATYGEEVTLANNQFTKNGYSFRGWSLTSDGMIEFIDGSKVINLINNSESVTLYAVWDLEDYNITYDLFEGILTKKVNVYNVLSDDFELGIPKKSGYEFIGWTGSNGDTPQINVIVTKGTYGNLNYVANYKKAKYRITYKSDEHGEITGKTEEEIDFEGNPTGTTKVIDTDYKHLKWAADKDVELIDGSVILEGDAISENDIVKIVVNDNIELTAYHYMTKYSIDYITSEQGVISGITSEEVAKDSTLLGTKVTANKGYEFSHWVADKDVTLSSGTKILKGDAISNEQLEEVVATEQLVFTAMYKIKTYDITYKSDINGVISGITEESKDYQESPTGTKSTPNTNYMFLCWIANVDVTLKDGTVIKSGDAITNSEVSEIVVDDNIELTAVHVKEILKVFYKGSDGIVIGEVSDEEVAYGANPTVVKYTQNNTNRNVVFVVDRDVYLKDGKKITKGTKMSLDQFKQVSVEDDLIVTIMYGEVEEIVNVPDTSMFGNNAGIIGGLLFIVFGICIFYGVLYKKQESN